MEETSCIMVNQIYVLVQGESIGCLSIALAQHFCQVTNVCKRIIK